MTDFLLPTPKYKIGQIVSFSSYEGKGKNPNCIVIAKIASINFSLCSDGYDVSYILSNNYFYSEHELTLYHE